MAEYVNVHMPRPNKSDTKRKHLVKAGSKVTPHYDNLLHWDTGHFVVEV